VILSFQVRSPVTALKGDKSDFIISGTLSLRSPVTVLKGNKSDFIISGTLSLRSPVTALNSCYALIKCRRGSQHLNW